MPVEPLPCFNPFAEICDPPSDASDISAVPYFLLVLLFLVTGSHGVKYNAVSSNLFILSVVPF